MDSIAVDTQHGATLMAGTSDGRLYRSTDGGSTWRYVDTLRNDGAITALAFDPAHPGVAVAGTSGSPGLYVSADDGRDWFPAYGLPAADGVLSLTVTSRLALPTAAVPPTPDSPIAQYFPQSHHTVSGSFLALQ